MAKSGTESGVAEVKKIKQEMLLFVENCNVRRQSTPNAGLSRWIRFGQSPQHVWGGAVIHTASDVF
jgi:hypothetical protein